MVRSFKLLLVTVGIFFSAVNPGYTQNTKKWTLQECISYALENNIEILGSEVSVKSTREDLLQAKSAILPNLNFSSNQGFSNQKIQSNNGEFKANGAYSGSYSLNSGVTLYNGGKLLNSLDRTKLSLKSSELTREEKKINLTVSVTEAYFNVLYAKESLNTSVLAVELSQKQLSRAEELFKAGSISSVELAQIKSQLSGDKYQLTVASNSLEQSELSLKQLLELGIDDDFEVFFPVLDCEDIVQDIPSLRTIYENALQIMPDIANSRLQIESARIEQKIAASETLPALSLSASIGTGNISGSSYSFSEQLNNSLNESIGVSLSFPLFNRRSTKTSINKAKLQVKQAELENTGSEKQLLSTIETLYQDAISARSRYRAATDKLKYSKLSYELVNEQYGAGMKNSVELLTEKQNYISAQQEQTEAKYRVILCMELLGLYQGIPVEL
jgi:outer membrane protein